MTTTDTRFAIGPQYAGGARAWTGFQNLPELAQRDLGGCSRYKGVR